MQKNYVLAALLAALVMGVGVIVGSSLRGDDVAQAPTIEPLRAEAPAGTPEAKEPKLLGTPLDEQILTRLARLEERIEVLTEQQRQLAKSVEPAAEIARVFSSRMPGLMRAKLSAGKTAAIATLRNCCSAQAQFQQSGKADTDGDGTGEYAGFREMSGAGAGRMRSALVPPVLSGVFRVLNANGEVSRGGYLFRMYLPGAGGEGIGEPTEGFTDRSGIDSDLSETTWCAYAWPVDAASGDAVYFMNQSGDTVATADARYVGPGNGPKADAAFQSPGTITGAVAIGQKGNDGNVWQQVN